PCILWPPGVPRPSLTFQAVAPAAHIPQWQSPSFDCESQLPWNSCLFNQMILETPRLKKRNENRTGNGVSRIFQRLFSRLLGSSGLLGGGLYHNSGGRAE